MVGTVAATWRGLEYQSIIGHHTFIATCMWHPYLAVLRSKSKGDALGPSESTVTPSFAGQNKAKRDHLRKNLERFQSWL